MPEESSQQPGKSTTWIWIVVGVAVSLVVIGLAAAAGIGYYIFRQTSIETMSAKDAGDRFEKVRSRFPDRRPYIELDREGPGIKIHRELEHPTESDLTALHILAWNDDKDHLVETSIPFWLVRLKSANPFRIQLGAIPRDLEVRAEDLARRGPGIVIDFQSPGKARVLVWAE